MKIETYKQGVPCWIELGSPDQPASKLFYADLFGRNYFDVEIEPSNPDALVYSNAKKSDEFVGAIHFHPDEVIASGMSAI